MKFKLFIGVMIAAALAIVVTTFSSATPTPPNGNVAVEKALHDLGYTTIPVRKTATHEFEINATLNGNKPITMMLSFQANSTIFNTKRLDELGLSYEKTGQDFSVNGDSDPLYTVRTDSINIGDGKIGPEELMCINFKEFDYFEDYRVTGILGRDFLFKYNAIIDFANQKLYLKTSE